LGSIRERIPGVGVKGGFAAFDGADALDSFGVEEEHDQRERVAVRGNTTRIARFTAPPGSEKLAFERRAGRR